jgi:hypothetical protein
MGAARGIWGDKMHTGFWRGKPEEKRQFVKDLGLDGCMKRHKRDEVL